MILDGQVLGLPLVSYRDTKTAIESLTGVLAGMTAYATDTTNLGYYIGTKWIWYASSGSFVGSVTGGGVISTGGFTLTVPATGTAALGAGTLTVSTTNAFSSSSHTHAITSSSTPGAAASLLASDAAGLLTLPQMALRSSIVAGVYALDISNPASTGDNHFRLYVGEPGVNDQSLMFRINTTDIFGLANVGGVYMLNAPTGAFFGDNLTIQKTYAGILSTTIYNQANDSKANAVLALSSLYTTGGDPYIHFNIAAVGYQWLMGLDNSDGDKFKLQYGSGNANNPLGPSGIGALTFDITGLATLASNVADTNTIANRVTISHNTTGTAADGFGASLQMQLESSTTADQAAAQLQWLWTSGTHASRTTLLRGSTVGNAVTSGYFGSWAHNAVANTAITIIPDGTGDVTAVGSFVYTIKDNTAATTGGGVVVLNPGGAAVTLLSDGTDTCQITCAANGSVTIARSAGTHTFSFSCWGTWQ